MAPTADGVRPGVLAATLLSVAGNQLVVVGCAAVLQPPCRRRLARGATNTPPPWSSAIWMNWIAIRPPSLLYGCCRTGPSGGCLSSRVQSQTAATSRGSHGGSDAFGIVRAGNACAVATGPT